MKNVNLYDLTNILTKSIEKLFFVSLQGKNKHLLVKTSNIP